MTSRNWLRRGQATLLLFLAAALAAGGAAGCRSSSRPDPDEEKDLRRVSDQWVWKAPWYDDDRTMRVLIDNGGPGPITVRLSESDQFPVAADSHELLCVTRGGFTLTVVDPKAETLSIGLPAPAPAAEEPKPLFVYNHHGLHDYQIVSGAYDERHYLSPVDAPDVDLPEDRELLGVVAFFAGSPDLLLEPLPTSVKAESFPATRTAINHLPSDAAARTWRLIATEGGAPLAVVETERNETIVQSVGVFDASTATRLYIDNPSGEPVGATLDGISLAELAPDETLAVQMPSGEHRLTLSAGDQERDALAFDFRAGSKYVWTPGARRQYTVEFEQYGTPEQLTFGTPPRTLRLPPGTFKPSSMTCRANRFFEAKVDLVFAEFPEFWRTEKKHVNGSRLVRQYARDFQPELRRELDELKRKAEESLDEDEYAEFSGYIDAVLAREHLSDCDLWKAEIKRRQVAGEEAEKFIERQLEYFCNVDVD